MIKLCAVLIALNNIQTIKSCLDSLDFADKIVVVDGGSDDGTVAVLQGYRIQLPLEVYEHPWPDHFGDQRQRSFDHAPVGDGVWWMRVDTDEIVPPVFRDNIHRLLDKLPRSIRACRVKQYNLVEDHQHYSAALGGWETHPRIWRASRKLRWRGQVHESVNFERGRMMENIPEDAIADLNLGIIHQGWLWPKLLGEKEKQYMGMEGSGFSEEGSLTERQHVVRRLPHTLRSQR